MYRDTFLFIRWFKCIGAIHNVAEIVHAFFPLFNASFLDVSVFFCCWKNGQEKLTIFMTFDFPKYNTNYDNYSKIGGILWIE